jgi:hypothetical protein
MTRKCVGLEVNSTIILIGGTVMTDEIGVNDSADANVVPVKTDEVGIDVTRQKPGTVIMVETEDEHLFEIKVTVPAKGVMEVSGTEPRLRKPVLGVLTHSFAGKTQINHWIGMLLKMSLVFRNGSYESAPVVHATVKGPGWKYDLF